MIASTQSVYTPPSTPSSPIPARTEVVVLGAGLTGLSIAQRLRAIGVDTVVVDARPKVGAGMATRGTGVASIQLLDPPFRLIEAVGLDRATEIVRFSAEGVAEWGCNLRQTGVAYATKGSQESGEVARNLAAMEQLGVAARPWSSETATGLSAGWIQPDGGTIDLQTEVARLARGLTICTECRVVDVGEEGFDASVRLLNGSRIRCDLVVMTGGAHVTPWAADKFYTVRHQALATEPVSRIADAPIYIQYGYTGVRQLPDGAVMISGCRWATPHLEVGETDDTVVNKKVHHSLKGFLHRHWPELTDAAISHQWSGIMTFSCDGLPIIGPLPGRPRVIACGGFGAHSASLSLRAARAVVEGIETGRPASMPDCFSPQRFG
ncbi:MAG: FAD-binding oxidoreductase [Myxococcota bacterium]|nr:FAD-binding oxidoreductase [Myxococcota bacterium]